MEEKHKDYEPLSMSLSSLYSVIEISTENVMLKESENGINDPDLDIIKYYEQEDEQSDSSRTNNIVKPKDTGDSDSIFTIGTIISEFSFHDNHSIHMPTVFDSVECTECEENDIEVQKSILLIEKQKIQGFAPRFSVLSQEIQRRSFEGFFNRYSDADSEKSVSNGTETQSEPPEKKSLIRRNTKIRPFTLRRATTLGFIPTINFREKDLTERITHPDITHFPCRSIESIPELISESCPKRTSTRLGLAFNKLNKIGVTYQCEQINIINQMKQIRSRCNKKVDKVVKSFNSILSKKKSMKQPECEKNDYVLEDYKGTQYIPGPCTFRKASISSDDYSGETFNQNRIKRNNSFNSKQSVLDQANEHRFPNEHSTNNKGWRRSKIDYFFSFIFRLATP
jgi:hypothetical protein